MKRRFLLVIVSILAIAFIGCEKNGLDEINFSSTGQLLSDDKVYNYEECDYVKTGETTLKEVLETAPGSKLYMRGAGTTVVYQLNDSKTIWITFEMPDFGTEEQSDEIDEVFDLAVVSSIEFQD